MDIFAKSSDHADFQKILSENCEEITSSLYDNNLAVVFIVLFVIYVKQPKHGGQLRHDERSL